MEALLGNRFAGVLVNIQLLAFVPDGVKLSFQRPGDKYYATPEAVKMDYPDYSPENQAREVLARMAETNVRPYFLERVYGYIRKFLRSLGLDGRYSVAEIKGFVGDAAERLRNSTPEQSRAGALSAAESLCAAEARNSLPGAIRELVEQTKLPGNVSHKLIVSPVSAWLARAGRRVGLQFDGYQHVIDSSAIRHTLKNHGDVAKERARGQLPVSDSDFEAIPTVLQRPDKLIFGTKNRLGRDQVVYVKTLEDGTTLYLEEVRTGRREMASQSMRKYPATMSTDSVVSTFYPNAQGDGGNKIIIIDNPAPRNGTQIAESVRPYVETARKGGKPWLMRSSAQKVADEVGGSVQSSGDGFIVRREVAENQQQGAVDAGSKASQTRNQADAGSSSADGTPDAIRSRILDERHAAVAGRDAGSAQKESRVGRQDDEMKAPPNEGLSSSGRTQTETPEFKKWFRHSKVVDEAGKPMVVYHGTDQKFTQFSRDKVGSNTNWDDANLGFLFIADRRLAENFARETSGGTEIMPVYLSIQNPLHLATQDLFTNKNQSPILSEISFNVEFPAHAGAIPTRG